GRDGAGAGVHIKQARPEAGRGDGANVDSGSDEGVAGRVDGVTLHSEEQGAIGRLRQVAGGAARIPGGEVIIGTEAEIELDEAAGEPDFGGRNRLDGIAAELIGQLAAGAQVSNRNRVDGVHLAVPGQSAADGSRDV